MSGLIEKAAATAAAHGLFERGAPVLAMVSGGADSVSLLRALASGALGDVSLSVLHVDHRLRGDASRGDAAFVAALCQRLAVPCRIVEVDVAAYAGEQGLNLEDAGRRIRYAEAEIELDARCAEAGAAPDRGRIATAHTFDDRAETVLMRLAQGAGASGLLALPYRRERIVRPLLDCTRAEVIDYLESLGQTWREDATNADTSRLRARIRAEVVPLFRGINPRFDDALARTLTLLGDEDDLLDEMARGFAERFAERTPDGPAGSEVRIDRSRTSTIARPIQRRMVRLLLFNAFPDASRLEFDHLEAICDGIASDSFARDLPGGLRAHSEYGTLVISRDGGPSEPFASLVLDVPGSVDLGDAGVITAQPGAVQPPDTDPLTALIDADAIEGALVVGSPEPGDRMRPLGMDGTRKLQDVLTDAKVPARLRPRTPVVRDGERIVWVAGVRLDDRYRVGPTTEQTVRLTWIPRDAGGTTR